MEGSVRARWNREKVLAHDEKLPLPWERFSARLIDETLVGAIAVALLVPGLIFEMVWLIAAGFLALFPGALLYEVVCYSRWGQTLGKRAKHLRVADLDTGRNPGMLQSTLRWLILFLAWWPWYSVMLNRTHRGPHDRLAHTIVVYSS